MVVAAASPPSAISLPPLSFLVPLLVAASITIHFYIVSHVYNINLSLSHSIIITQLVSNFKIVEKI